MRKLDLRVPQISLYHDRHWQMSVEPPPPSQPEKVSAPLLFPVDSRRITDLRSVYNYSTFNIRNATPTDHRSTEGLGGRVPLKRKKKTRNCSPSYHVILKETVHLPQHVILSEIAVL